MDLIEVDPKLFVTCRLCLEDLGQFQIAPWVQERIKYCFDIHVESFDGLPQLICGKCKNILKNFYTIKKTFSEKQTNLKEKLLKKQAIYVEPQQDTVSSSQPATETLEEDTFKLKSKRRKRILSSTSSSGLDFEKSPNTTSSQQKRTRTHSHTDWKSIIRDSQYQKRMVCMLCNCTRAHKRSIISHLKTHDQLKAKFKDVFSRQYVVKLEKIDAKPNVGFNNMVVHDINKVVEPCNSNYYILYTKKNHDAENFENIQSKTSNNVAQQDSDDNEETLVKAKQKRRRLLSRSSNETVVIETNRTSSDNEEETQTAGDTADEAINNEQCINIDDSSDNDSDREKLDTSLRLKPSVEAQLCDYKVIQGIISTCVTAFVKKCDSIVADINSSDATQKRKMYKNAHSQLIHKVLSIGRKVINKQGFNCTGLLRYMEHKDLDIIWMIKPLSYSSRDINYIRILTKLRGLELTDDMSGWEKVPIYVPNDINIDNVIVNTDTITTDTSIKKLEIIQPPQQKEQSAMLQDNDGCTSVELKKLLNANPVANPKQLPKKIVVACELKPNKIIMQPNLTPVNIEEDNSFCLPIITSTTSLAEKTNTEDNQPSKKSTVSSQEEMPQVPQEKAAPRIKVKPVSELMSERVLNSLSTGQLSSVTDSNMLTSQIDSVWPHQKPINVYVPNINSQIHAPNQQIQIVPVSCQNTTPTYQAAPSPTITILPKDSVILDTVELPNTKTESPFKYLKDLLQIHNIVLLDPNNTLGREFVCLIKFRVVFKQDATPIDPLVICLSMFCHKNVFCIKVRDKHQIDVDIHKLTANWQWEILRAFSGDVANKVVLTAQRISTETHDFAKKLCCVLNSIRCTKVA